MSSEEYDRRIDDIENLMTILEEKNEDDNAALAREISKLWEAIHEIHRILDYDTDVS